MKTIIHKYSGASLKDLKEKYGLGSAGFYDQQGYESEKFFTEHAPKGTYELKLSNDLAGLNYKEQLKKIEKGWSVPHPAIVAEAILEHYKQTGERLYSNYWLRTLSEVGSDGLRVCAGRFDSVGLCVAIDWDDSRDDSLGLASARKFKKNPEPSNLDTLDASDIVVEVGGKRYKLKEIE